LSSWSAREARHAALVAVSAYLPAGKLTNEQLAREHREWSVERILAATGIRVRSIAAPDEYASDLAVRAAERLFASTAWRPAQIDFLVCCTQSPDQFVPATASTIHQRLGLARSCGSLDLNQGSSGYVYGLSVAKGLVECGCANTVLLVTTDTYSKFIPRGDFSARSVFSDGAAASVVTVADTAQEWIGPFVFGTDGTGATDLRTVRETERRVDARGDDERTACTGTQSGHRLVMHGQRVFNFTIQAVPALVRSLLDKAQTSLDDIDHVIFHQANGFMLEHLREQVGIPRDKFRVSLETAGNTVSSTIPIALHAAVDEGRIRDGDRLMLVGFGAGYSWAGTMLTWHGSHAPGSTTA
jgi:3-oxoacyl-[acyl-carrier-protein] synthase-3